MSRNIVHLIAAAVVAAPGCYCGVDCDGDGVLVEVQPDVLANWTGTIVHPGDEVDVVADGWWNCGAGWTDVRGQDPRRCRCPVEGRFCALIARVGIEPWLEVGAHRRWTYEGDQPALLSFATNDNLGENLAEARELYGDNENHRFRTVEACVRVWRPLSRILDPTFAATGSPSAPRGAGP